MNDCKRKDCDEFDSYDDVLCPICGFCDWCHRDSDIEGTCASFLVTQKTEHFKVRVSGSKPTYECGKCGCYKFIVGRTDNYETSIKCPRCGFERIVHDG